MSSNGNGWNVVRPLIYLGGLALVFLLGTGFGLGISSRWGATPEPSISVFVTATPGSTRTDLDTALPGATPCGPPPSNWMLYTIRPGDTLSLLARRFQVSTVRIMRANCLASEVIEAGSTLYLPPLLTPTPCALSSPEGWTIYTVQSGDALSTLAAARGISVEAVIRANCLASDDIAEGQTLYLPPLPTPTPCAISSPGGWELYTVESGDTLFGLATARGTTTAEVMQVNCLPSETLGVGDTLYLPALPTPTPTEPLPPTPTLPTVEPQVVAQLSSPGTASAQPPGVAPQPPDNGQAESPFSRRGNLLAFTQQPVLPNAPDPCSEPPKGHMAGEPWIFASLISINNEHQLERGQRVYYFACNFTDPIVTPQPTPQSINLTATMIWPNGKKQTLDVQYYLPPTVPPFELGVMGNAVGVFTWYAICNLPLGQYSLVIKDNIQNRSAQINFELKKAEFGRILPVPEAGSAGTTFYVFYCDYEPNTRVTVDLFYQAARLIYATPTPRPTPEPQCPSIPCSVALHDPDISWKQADRWEVFINSDGWASHTLPSSKGDLGVAYLLKGDSDQDGYSDYEKVIWLFR